MPDNTINQIDFLKKKISQVQNLLKDIQMSLDKLEFDSQKPDYSQIDGVVGKYDGANMITEAGEKYDVPGNYAAKSKLVYGDTLKMINEDGKTIFKQIEKVNRTRVEGILTKKEGEWFLLTDRGSYRVSSVAADFQKAQFNSEAVAFLPADNLDAPFATIDSIMTASSTPIPVVKNETMKNPVVKETRQTEPIQHKETLQHREVRESKPVHKEPAPRPQSKIETKETAPKKAPIKTANRPQPKREPRRMPQDQPAVIAKPEESSANPKSTSTVIEDDDLI